MSKRLFAMLMSAALICLSVSVSAAAQDEAAAPLESGYAPVNGLEMYYEIYGTGEPLVVLHGAFVSIRIMGDIVTSLAETRQVIAIETQGHGRTNDADRPLTYEGMADDVAALLDYIGVEKADIFGYSMGGNTALQVAVRHPEMVDKLVVVSTTFDPSGYQPGLLDAIATFTPEFFAGDLLETEYMELAPNPENWPVLIEKVIALNAEHFQGWSPESIQAISAPTLVIVGDSDAITLEHAVELFRLRGGGVNGDFTGLPESQLAVLPASSHVSLVFRVDALTAIIAEFLDNTTPAPMF